MFSRIWHFRRSILVQLVLLTTAVFALLFTQFALIPSWEGSDDKENAYYTRSVIYHLIHKNIDNPDKDFLKIESNKNFKKVLKANPKLRYYIETKREKVSFGGEPRRVDYPQAAYILNTKKNTQYPCSHYSEADLPFTENGTISMAHYNNCPGKFHYLEVAGIEKSAFTRMEIMSGYVRQLFVVFIEEYLFLGSSIFLLAIFSILKIIRSFKTVAKVTKKYDLGKKHINISEKSLPLEIRPLIRSLNEMLVRVDESHEKQEFFLAAAAHELRTPLTIIRMRIDELPQSGLKDAMWSDIRSISKLVEQLLLLTKLKSMNDLDCHSVDLVDLARQVCASRAPLAIDKQVDVELKIDAPLVNIEGDREIISVGIANLVDNALSVSKVGDCLIVEVKSNGRVLVHDKGPGVPKEKRKGIFEPFAKNPPNRSGHGLGLSIVKTIMHLHGGRVDQRNIVEGGSIFTLHFNITPLITTAP